MAITVIHSQKTYVVILDIKPFVVNVLHDSPLGNIMSITTYLKLEDYSIQV